LIRIWITNENATTNCQARRNLKQIYVERTEKE